MSLRTILLVLIILTAAGLGLVAYMSIQPPTQVVVQAPAPQAPPPPATVKILSAARPLPAGTLARDDDFRGLDVPSDRKPDGALLDTPEVRAEIRGALIRSYIEVKQPVLGEALLRPRDRGFLAAVLSPGTRAVSIPVDNITGVSGLIWPGDRVDVLLVQEIDAPTAQRIFSETILPDVRVIAVGQHIVQGAASSEGVTGYVVNSVTLQASEEDAQRLVVAQRIGRLTLVIRSAEPPPVAVASDAGAIFSGDVSPTLGRRSSLVGLKIRVIQGESSSEVSFK
jgi:pilus assembly protein CpaB